VFAKLKAKLQGWRTTIGASAIGIIGALQIFGAVDITPLLKLFLHDDQIVGAVMVIMAVVMGYLRYITSTPVGTASPTTVAAAAATDAGDSVAPSFNRGVDAGS